MRNIGESLKQARIDQNYSLEDMQRITKIQQKYIKAIEDNDLVALPGDFYYKTFVRQYADVVGLDGDALLSQTADQANEVDEDTVDSAHDSNNASIEDESKQSEEEETSDQTTSDSSVSFDEPLGYVTPVGNVANETADSSEEDSYFEPMASSMEPEHEEEYYDLGEDEHEENNYEDEEEFYDEDEEEDYYEDEEERGCLQRLGCLIGAVILVAIVAAIAYFVLGMGTDSDSSDVGETVEAPATETNDSASSTSQEQDPEEQSSTDDTANAEPVTIELDTADGTGALYNLQSNGSGQYDLVLTASGEESWVSVSSDGELNRQAILSDGESLEITLPGDVSSIELAIGNVPATQVTINETSVEFPEDSTGNPSQYFTFSVESEG